ncbi:MAG: outer membrane lipoprotein-sorting protein [Chthoniobacterales bacterium]
MRQEITKARRWPAGACGALAALLLLSPATADDTPHPQQLLQAARLGSTSQQATLRGQLRSGPELSPFTLQVDFGKLRFSFDRPSRVIEVRLGEDSAGVFDGAGRPIKKGMQEPVAEGTDVTAEDLSLGFLYWPDVRLLGEERVRGRPAWQIELRPGQRGSSFAVVRIWQDKDSGALLRIEGFDWQGKLLRRFEVVSGQRIDGQWMLKQMRIERFAPEDAARPVTRSYLEILGKEGA